MAAGVIAYFYRRLGGRYPLVFLAVELQTALLIVAGTLAPVHLLLRGRPAST